LVIFEDLDYSTKLRFFIITTKCIFIFFAKIKKNCISVLSYLYYYIVDYKLAAYAATCCSLTAFMYI
jgi:hypothetical protein